MTMLFSLILVIVCVNVAILVYARTATRMGEIAVRTALGASRGRIVAQLFAESLVLSVGAAAVGLFVVKVAFDWARSSVERARTATFWTDYSLPGPALVYVVALTVLAAVITGVIPALQATGRRVTVESQSIQQRLRTAHGPHVDDAHRRAGIDRVCRNADRRRHGLVRGPGIFIMPVSRSNRSCSPKWDSTVSRHRARHCVDRAALAARFANANGIVPKARSRTGVVGHTFTLDLPTRGRPACGDRERRHGVRPARARGAAIYHRPRLLSHLRRRRAGRTSVPRRRSRRGRRRCGHRQSRLRGPVARRRRGSGRRIRYVPDSPRGSTAPPTERWYEVVGVVENIDTNPFGRDLVDPRVYHPLKKVEGSRARLAVRIDVSQHRRSHESSGRSPRRSTRRSRSRWSPSGMPTVCSGLA